MKRVFRPGAAAILSLSVTFLAGCAWGFGGTDDAIADMHRQFSRTVDIQTAVVLGDLDRARAAGTWLATHEARSPFPAESEAYRAQMKGYASLIGQAENLQAAATQTGHMAASCGSCHEALGSGPRFVLHSGPPEVSSHGSRMVGYIWAADRMWEGLVGPSEDSWQAGVRALGSADPSAGTAMLASTSPRGSLGISEQIPHLAATAATAVTREERAMVYGQLLETCNRCHSLEGVMTRR